MSVAARQPSLPPAGHIVFFGTYNTETTPRVQALIEGLRARGLHITECNVPLRVDTAARVAILRQPWRVPGLVARIASCWTRLAIRARRAPPANAVVVGYMGQFDVHLARRLFRRTPIVLDYMVSLGEAARDRRLSTSAKARLLRRIDESALRAADVIVVDTEEHRQLLPDNYRAKGVVVPVGAPQPWFDAAAKRRADAPGARPLSVIFFGFFTPLQGAPVIGRALAQLKTPIEVTMVGTGQDEAAAKEAAAGSPARITWRNWVPGADLPALTARHDVCLGVFGTGPKTARVVPNKVFQGAAAGCAIVTADTPPQRRLFGPAAVYVPAGDAQALARQLDYLAAHPAETARLRRAAHDLARRRFTPAEIITPLLEALRGT